MNSVYFFPPAFVRCCVESPDASATQAVLGGLLLLPLPWPRSSSPTGCLREVWYPAQQRPTPCSVGTARRLRGKGSVRCNTHPVKSEREKKKKKRKWKTTHRIMTTPRQLPIPYPRQAYWWALRCKLNARGLHGINNISAISNLLLFFSSLSGLYRSELSLVTAVAAVVINLIVLSQWKYVGARESEKKKRVCAS